VAGSSAPLAGTLAPRFSGDEAPDGFAYTEDAQRLVR
jgi:hypothetical protein